MNNTSSTTSAFKDRSLEAALDALGEAGFPQAEITGSEPHVCSTDDRERPHQECVRGPLRPPQDHARPCGQVHPGRPRR